MLRLLRSALPVVFALICTTTFAQKITPLERLSTTNYELKPGQAIVYGNFIARKQKFMNSGFQQYVILRNIQTKEFFRLEGIRYLKTKTDAFAFHLPAGTYQLILFIWSDSKWYGSKTYTEPLYADIDGTDTLTLGKIQRREMPADSIKQYTFKVENGKTYYIGTWDFYNGVAAFRQDKQADDEKMKNKFAWIDFDTALTSIPEKR